MKTQKLDQLVRMGMEFWDHFRKYEQMDSDKSMLKNKTLMFISSKRSVSISDIAKQFNISLPAASTLVKRLRKTELIERKENPENRRSTIIKVTPKGHEFIACQEENMRNEFKSIFEGIEEKDIDTYLKVQRKIVQNMKRVQSQS